MASAVFTPSPFGEGWGRGWGIGYYLHGWKIFTTFAGVKWGWATRDGSLSLAVF
jgi:hypothetical protein